MNNENELKHAGFWIRVLASIIDDVFLLLTILPVSLMFYSVDEFYDSTNLIVMLLGFLFTFILPALAEILFWVYFQATPGKMLVCIKIVDAKTGCKPTPSQCVGRYFAYFISILFLYIGFLWVAFDKKKQGWHDKLAGTLVVKTNSTQARQVESAD